MCQKADRRIEIVNERNTTQECEDCLALTGPKGAGWLGIRKWTCSECGVVHNRDVCSARNILWRGFAPVLEAAVVTGRRPGAQVSMRSERRLLRTRKGRPSTREQIAQVRFRAKAATRRGAVKPASETGAVVA